MVTPEQHFCLTIVQSDITIVVPHWPRFGRQQNFLYSAANAIRYTENCQKVEVFKDVHYL